MHAKFPRAANKLFVVCAGEDVSVLLCAHKQVPTAQIFVAVFDARNLTMSRSPRPEPSDRIKDDYVDALEAIRRGASPAPPNNARLPMIMATSIISN